MDKGFGLPRELGEGLLLRWATVADTDDLARFNVCIHSSEQDNPDETLDRWTRDLMNGEHPTTGADDFTVVVDKRNNNKIVSSLNLISQRWAYDGIEFGVGRPELVGTDPEYRRRGLVRAQMEVVHAKSAARGEMLQAITGIPWYYRLFGYEMTVNLGGQRLFFWDRPGNYKKQDEGEIYQLRPATPADIPLLQQLYQEHCAQDLLVRVRNEALWKYELTKPHRDSPYARHLYIVETDEDRAVAYLEYRQWGSSFVVREFGVLPGHSWRAVALYLTRFFKEKADALNQKREKPITRIAFSLGTAHPVYEALGRQLEYQHAPYAWYVRVPDLAGFLRHVQPVLEKRLANSVLSGHSGAMWLNFYREHMKLVFDKGELKEIGSFMPKRLEEGDAVFPELTFLQLVFGYRSFDELDASFADCYAKTEARILLNILFPKRPSAVVALG